MQDLLLKALSDFIPVVMVLGITEIIKRAFVIDTKYIPLVTLFISLCFVIPYCFFYYNTDIISSIIIAIFIALSASGLWSWGKKTLEK